MWFIDICLNNPHIFQPTIILYMIRNEKQIDNNNNDNNKKIIFVILNWNCVCHLCFAYIVDHSLLANIVQPVPSD